MTWLETKTKKSTATAKKRNKNSVLITSRASNTYPDLHFFITSFYLCIEYKYLTCLPSSPPVTSGIISMVIWFNLFQNPA